jgi:hypothetical protein
VVGQDHLEIMEKAGRGSTVGIVRAEGLNTILQPWGKPLYPGVRNLESLGKVMSVPPTQPDAVVDVPGISIDELFDATGNDESVVSDKVAVP